MTPALPLTRTALCLALAFAAPAAALAQSSPGRSIELVHQLELDKAAVLQQLVDSFNRANPGQPIEIVQRDWKTSPTLPHLLLLDGRDTESFLAGNPRYKPVHALMREAGQPLDTLKPPAQMARTAVDAKGQLNALPVALSTPVMYYNRSALRKVGLNPDTPPRTWPELQQTLGRLAESGHTCPYTVAQPGRVMVENGSAWHNQPYTTVQGKKDVPSFNSLFQIKHVAMMASWTRARYLHIFPRDQEAEERFAAGDCAVLAAPSSSYGKFRRHANFEIGVATLPYYDDIPGAPQNTLADGPALWVASGKQSTDYKTIARFIRYWLEPAQQVAWQRDTGYLPLNRAGVFAAQSPLLADGLENIQVAFAQLTHKQPTASSSAGTLAGRESVRSILDEELAGVWRDTQPAKAALDNAASRAQLVR